MRTWLLLSIHDVRQLIIRQLSISSIVFKPEERLVDQSEAFKQHKPFSQPGAYS